MPAKSYSGSGNIDLSILVKKIENVEKAIKNMILTGDLELTDGRTGTNKYKAHLTAKAEYSRQIR